MQLLFSNLELVPRTFPQGWLSTTAYNNNNNHNHNNNTFIERLNYKSIFKSALQEKQ